MSKIADLAIIGGGASSVLLLAALAENPESQGLRVDVYERVPERIGRGIAYSTKHSVHLLNVRAANMSALDHDRADFARWAAVHGFVPEDFVPRKIYGQYLEEKLARAKEVLQVTVRTEDALSVKHRDGGYDVETAQGQHRYKLCVQATGNVSPQRPQVDGDIQGYYDDPWSADYESLCRTGKIALIGSGLTAVDAVLALQEKAYEGKVLILSRHALPPAPHVAPAGCAPFLGAEDETKPLSELMRLIRRRIAQGREEGLPWQAVIDALRGNTNPVWQAMTEQSRARFMKRCFTLWNVHRHRMAPQIAQTLEDLRSKGRVEFVKGSVSRIAPGPRVVFKDGDALDVDAVINCLGYRYQEQGRVFDVWDRIGPARFGPLFETTAIPEIRAQAAEIARHIAARLG